MFTLLLTEESDAVDDIIVCLYIACIIFACTHSLKHTYTLTNALSHTHSVILPILGCVGVYFTACLVWASIRSSEISLECAGEPPPGMRRLLHLPITTANNIQLLLFSVSCGCGCSATLDLMLCGGFRTVPGAVYVCWTLHKNWLLCNLRR